MGRTTTTTTSATGPPSAVAAASSIARALPFLALLVACATSPPEGDAPPGDFVVRLDGREADGRRRSYRLHVPPRKGAAAPVPLVLVLHGSFDSARGMEEKTGLSRLADREGFVAVYPNGYGFLGLLRHWNAGHCCGRARRLGLDDVAFLDAVLDDVARRVPVDPARVYVVGESNGGMLAHLYAAARSRRIAAAAVVAGTIGSRAAPDAALERIPSPAAPVPVAIVHGTADRAIPFDGGPPHGEASPEWASAPAGARFWATHNDADPEPRVTRLREGRIVRAQWEGQLPAAPVVLLEIDGWPHAWPGPESTSALPEDDPLRGFDAAEEIWEFLRRHRRPGDMR